MGKEREGNTPGEITGTQLEDEHSHAPKEWPWELPGAGCRSAGAWSQSCQALDARVSRGCSGRKTSPRAVQLIHLLLSLSPVFQFQAPDTVVHGTVEALRVNESVNKHR